MSSLYVRNLVRQWCAALPTQFYDTVNVSQNPQDRIWLTVDWLPSYNTKLSFCQDFVESGSFNLVWIGPPGIGDIEVLTAATADITAFMAQADPAGLLVLKEFEPPEDFSTADGVPKFGVSITVVYDYYH